MLFSTVDEERDIPESGIEDSDVVIEELERITIDRGPSGHSKTPSGWLGSLSRDVRWYRSAREEKDGDPAGIPLH